MINLETEFKRYNDEYQKILIEFLEYQGHV